MTPKRTRPLSAASATLSAPSPEDVVMDVDPDDLDELAVERHARFADGVERLRVGSASGFLNERLLLVLAGIVAPLGLVLVVFGWWGASQTPYAFEQTPYLISGGLLGLGLVFLGSFFYFAHWLTQLVKEHREQSAAILAALERLSDTVAETGPPARNGRRTRAS